MNIDTKSYSSGTIDIHFQEVGNIVFAIRNRMGLTQKQLAKKMGVSQAYIAKLETRKEPPSLKFQIKLAEVSGATLSAPKFGFMF